MQTHIPIPQETRNPISYASELLLLGSCFSENIAQKLSYYKFAALQNPFGILFHPKAIENLIVNAINEKEYTEDDVFEFNEQWQSFEAHSEMNASSPEEILKQLNTNSQLLHNQLQKASHVIITLGTAWVYRHIATDTLVANCHKVPQKQFLKELLSVSEVAETLEAIVSLIRSVNEESAILFTVSPVRHLKDGFTKNQQSKAHLVAAVHQVIGPRKKVHYFPSYEILLDELRDYRFYKEDMIHPNEMAITYIWEKFAATWITNESKTVMKQVETIQKGLAHRPFNSDSEAHRKFLDNIAHQIDEIQSKYPRICF